MNRSILKQPTILIALGLITLMATTRYHHFGDALHLPDASLAVFFLAGIYIRRIELFVVLIIVAVLCDYLAITQEGVSDFCITLAYSALLPTYAIMWFGGRWCANYLQSQLKHLFAYGLVFFVSTLLAFNISSGSFYLWSGYFDPNWVEYSQRIADYFPPYLKAAFVYAIAAVFAHAFAININKLYANKQHGSIK